MDGIGCNLIQASSNSNMIEIVARALCRNAGYDPDGKQQLGEGWQDEQNWTFFVQSARIAIGALLQPTKEMIGRAFFDAVAADAEAVWKTMIKTALGSAAPA